MRAVGIETSGTVGSVALVEDGGRVLGEESFEKGLRHGQALIPALERILVAAQVAKRDVDLFAVGTGPGSYTGLRVGIIAAKALSFALKKPLLGVPSFDALARALAPATYEGKASLVIAEDARRDHVYCARYLIRHGALARAGDFDVRAPDQVLEGAPRPLLLVGNAAAKYAVLRADPQATIAPPEAGHAPARAVAAIALERFARGERETREAVEPLYLRPSIPEERRG